MAGLLETAIDAHGGLVVSIDLSEIAFTSADEREDAERGPQPVP